MLVECENCGWNGDSDDTDYLDARHVYDNTEVGSIFTKYGCLNCGGMCFPTNPIDFYPYGKLEILEAEIMKLSSRIPQRVDLSAANARFVAARRRLLLSALYSVGRASELDMNDARNAHSYYNTGSHKGRSRFLEDVALTTEVHLPPRGPDGCDNWF